MGTKGEADVIDERGRKDLTSFIGVDVKEDTGDTNDLLLQSLLKEDDTVIEGWWQVLQVGPNIKSGLRLMIDTDPNLTEGFQNQITFGPIG